MKVVYICSPYSNKNEEIVKENIENAKRYSHFAVRKNVVPITPHLMFTQYLTEKERELALTLDLEIISRVDELWVFSDTISQGMATEINFAKKNKIKIRYFSKYLQEVHNEVSNSKNEI